MSPSTLSLRGQKNVSSGEHMARFFDVISNPYDEVQNPNGIISLGSSENFMMHDELADYVNQNFKVTAATCTYGEGATGSRRLRAAMANHINLHFNPVYPLKAEDVSFASGVTAINEMYAWSLADEGDGILMSKPIYAAFENDLTTKAKMKTIYVSLQGVDPFGVEAVEKYEQALKAAEENGTKVRSILISNPHNPLGQCYPLETLKAFFRLCQNNQIHLISDEIYALSVFEGADPNALPFTSVFSIDTVGLIDPNLLHVLYGMSKDFGFGGLRLGCLVTRNEELKKAMRAISMFHWPSGLSVEMAALLLEDQTFIAEFTKRSRKRLAENYRLATGILEKAGIKYHQGSNAGFFLWADFSPYLASAPDSNDPYGPERRLSKKFLDARVYLASGEDFQSDEPGWFRIIFAQEQKKLIEGLERVIAVVKLTP